MSHPARREFLPLLGSLASVPKAQNSGSRAQVRFVDQGRTGDRKIVTPGLVDIHVHVYDGVAPLAIPADPNCIAKGAFSWEVMSAAMKEDVVPGTISSDLHQFNVAGPVFDVVTTLAKFLHLGMPLEKVIECATINPARAFRFPNQPGTLRVGSEADLAVFQILEGDFEMLASSLEGPLEKRIVHRKILPMATVKGGHLYGTASIPVVRA